MPSYSGPKHINPDGPEAAVALSRLQERPAEVTAERDAERAANADLGAAVRNATHLEVLAVDRARVAEAGLTAARAEIAELKRQREGQIDYGIDLQRIIEALCHGRDIPAPQTTARHHYDMAVAARAEIERLKTGLRDALAGWADAAQYKGDFLREKHGDMEELEELRVLLVGEPGK